MARSIEFGTPEHKNILALHAAEKKSVEEAKAAADAAAKKAAEETKKTDK